jgi:hypothetical protein
MGYACYFELTVIGADKDEVMTELEDITGFDFDDLYSWREQDDHMMRLAKRFPDAAFKLRREGEEAGDVSLHYYALGYASVEQQAELVFPDPPLWFAQAQLARDQAQHGAERVEGEQG